MTTLKNEIKSDKSKVFRTVQVKRRLASTGLYETNWQDLSTDVKKWGTIKSEIDAIRLNKFKFGNIKMTFANDTGKYNNEDDPASFWFGFLPIQRSLVRIKTGFFKDTTTAEGIVIREQFPSENSLWDSVNVWDDAGSQWDDSDPAFKGIISGDILTSDKNTITFNIRPTIQIFRDYPAQNIAGYGASGTSASDFMNLVRDHTDSVGNHIFRPFFGDSLSGWNIQTTTANYPDLNTTTAEDVIDKNVWQIMEKLAEAENFVVYVNRSGVFTFKDKNNITSTAYEFHGLNSGNTEFGHTIKKINSYGERVSKFYSRVQIKHAEPDTSTSYEVVEATLTVSPQSSAWLYGVRTLNINNRWISAAVANSIATSIFNEVSAIKNEIKFSTSFVPQLDILDRATITYNSGEFHFDSLWDLNNWADTIPAVEVGDLIWNRADGEALDFIDKEFKLLSYEIDLDKLESRFVAREV